METFLATYRGLMEPIPRPKESGESNEDFDQSNVILTGSTGTTGIYLLRALLDRPGIGHIFCLNRGEDWGQATQYQKSLSARLSTSGFEKRVTFLKADFHFPSLGLGSSTYDSVQKQVGMIIHAAWPVNFNLPLSAFAHNSGQLASSSCFC